TKVIDLYYGNAQATSAASGTDTFIVFDDFDGTTLDASKWTVINAGAASVSGGRLSVTKAGSDPGKVIAKTAPSGANVVLRARFQVTGGANADERLGLSIKTDATSGQGYNYVLRNFAALNEQSFLDDRVAWAVRAGNWAKNTWYT